MPALYIWWQFLSVFRKQGLAPPAAQFADETEACYRKSRIFAEAKLRYCNWEMPVFIPWRKESWSAVNTTCDEEFLSFLELFEYGSACFRA